MMIVHFPVALLSVDLIFSMLGVYFSQTSLLEAAYYCLIAGVITGWLAIMAGITDLFRYILKNGDTAIRTAIRHGAIQSFVILVFTGFLSAEFNVRDYITTPPTWLWIGKGLLLLLMVYGNYVGGELVMQYIAKSFQRQNRR